MDAPILSSFGPTAVALATLAARVRLNWIPMHDPNSTRPLTTPDTRRTVLDDEEIQPIDR